MLTFDEAEAEPTISSLLSNKSDIEQAADQTTPLSFPPRILVSTFFNDYEKLLFQKQNLSIVPNWRKLASVHIHSHGASPWQLTNRRFVLPGQGMLCLLLISIRYFRVFSWSYIFRYFCRQNICASQVLSHVTCTQGCTSSTWFVMLYMWGYSLLLSFVILYWNSLLQELMLCL